MTIICFSATASFASGAVLLAVGSIAVRRAHKPDYAYAAIPLLFGIQQIIEGGLWLVLAEHASSQQCLTVGYLGFANILWPIYAPLAIWLMEPKSAHRKRLLLPLIAGVVTAIFFAHAIATHPISADIVRSHIRYRLPHDNEEIMFAFYATATCLAPLLSVELQKCQAPRLGDHRVDDHRICLLHDLVRVCLVLFRSIDQHDYLAALSAPPFGHCALLPQQR